MRDLIAKMELTRFNVLILKKDQQYTDFQTILAYTLQSCLLKYST